MQSHTLTKHNATLRFHDIPGPGRPLVFVHGLGCASSCDCVIADPALTRRRFILIDLLGSGFSDHPENFSYSIEDHARTILDLLDGLALPEVDLFGHSMGGAVAISVAGLQPERIRRLVLAEPNLDNGGGMFSRAIAAYTEADYVTYGHADNIKNATETGNLVWAKAPWLSRRLSAFTAMRYRWCAVAIKLAANLAVIANTQNGYFLASDPCPIPMPIFSPAAGVSAGVVPNAGHSMMWENPSGLALAIEHALSTPDAR